MLGKHPACLEHAQGVEPAFCDDALTLAEQIRQDALVFDSHVVDKVRGHEIHRQTVLLLLDRAVLDHAADPEQRARFNFAVRHLRG